MPGTGASEGEDGEQPDIDGLAGGEAVPAAASGYIEVLRLDDLMELACKHDLTVRMERDVGDFVAEGTSLATVITSGRVDQDIIKQVQELYAIGRQRTLQQDFEFGLRQLVDIALKALSPGINDVTTAVTCLDRLGQLLRRLALRELPSPYRYDNAGRLRIVARSPTFAAAVGLAFDQVRTAGQSQSAVLLRMLEIIEDLAAATTGPHRRRVLLDHANRVGKAADRGIEDESDRAVLNAELCRLGRLLRDVGTVEDLSVHRR